MADDRKTAPSASGAKTATESHEATVHGLRPLATAGAVRIGVSRCFIWHYTEVFTASLGKKCTNTSITAVAWSSGGGGSTRGRCAFTHALIASGLFRWVKILEIILGATMLLNRAMPLTLMALVPINVVIVYWNLVLDPATVDYVFGVLSIVFNLLLLWPWRARFYPLFVWQGQADYSAQENGGKPL